MNEWLHFKPKFKSDKKQTKVSVRKGVGRNKTYKFILLSHFSYLNSYYFNKWHRKAANPHIYEAKQAILFTFLIGKITETINQLSGTVVD